jgi:biopolymer transport protein ExbD
MSMGNTEKCEPNLVPLLDLVLQMIMFFMLCGNFASEDLNASIKLPAAIQAKPLDKSEDYVITLNVDKFRDEKGKVINDDRWRVLVRGADPLTNARQVQTYLNDKMALDQKRVDAAKEKGKEAKISLVVVRGDERCSFKDIHAVLEACRQSGYRDVQLRATVARSKK